MVWSPVAADVAAPLVEHAPDRAGAVRGGALVTAALAAACQGGVTLTVDGDRAVPAELDALCVGVADRDHGGGSFGRTYLLEGRLGRLPQTLAVEAGGADAATAWARGYRGGVVVAADRAPLDFDDDVTLRLDRCPRATAGTVARAGGAAVGATALVASEGHGGVVAVAVRADGAALVDVEGGAVVSEPAAGLAGEAAVAMDVDRDCDDDLVVVGGGAATVWTRVGRGFVEGVRLGDGVRAAVSLDVDGDGDQDLVTAGGGQAALHLGDGTGAFAAAPATALAVTGLLTAASAVAAGDLDGDGHGDVVIAQAGGPPRAFLGDATGAGVLVHAPAVLPPVSLDVRALALTDLDGDGDADLLATVADGPARLFVNRGGLLEQQPVRLPDSPAGAAVAAGDWDGDCAADVAVAGAVTSLLRGGADGVFAVEASLPGAAAAVLADVDDDGDPDLLTGTAAEVTWYRR